jgi:hypothetical protein
MKKLLILLALLAPLAASAQIPDLTNESLLKFQAGNSTFLRPLEDLVDFVNAGSGTVTSVDVSGGSTGLTTSGGPITSSGTITLAGTLGAGFGGTGLASYAVGDLLYASGTTTLSKLAGVATGNALISGGVTTAPSWGKIGLTTHISGTLAVGNGGTGLTALGGDGTVLASNGSANVYLSPTVTTSAAAIAFARNGSNLELNLPNADASNRGTVSTGSQTFAGAKTFNGFLTAGAGVTSTASASAAALYATGVTGGTWVAETSTATLDETDNFVEIGTLSAAITINLPACNATRNGWVYEFLKTGTDIYGVIIDPNGSETFTDSATTKTIYSQGNGAKCKCRWNGSAGTWFFSTQM